jgi:hypothetical protein
VWTTKLVLCARCTLDTVTTMGRILAALLLQSVEESQSGSRIAKAEKAVHWYGMLLVSEGTPRFLHSDG